jgi:hypothetical protein
VTALSLTPVTTDGFSIQVSESDGAITVKCSGNGGMDATPLLNAFLRQLHAEAGRLAVREVVADFRDMYFMNSSCFKCLVSWLSTVVKTGGERYGVRFLSNSQLHWQKRSLEALRCLAPDVVQVESS